MKKTDLDPGYRKDLAIVYLHNYDIWMDELLDRTLFGEYFYRKAFSKIDRFVIEEKNRGLTNGELAKILKCTPQTIRRRLYNIKQKFRNGMDIRVDDKYGER